MLDIFITTNYHIHIIILEDYMIFRGTVKIEQEEEWFVATCLENNITSQGRTVNDAFVNLKEAIALYYEDEEKKKELNIVPTEQVYITQLEMAV
jgi:predicted RNase H-like HicB family nuclease